MLREALSPALLRNPASVKLLHQRVNIMGSQGRWKEAAADAARCIELKPSEHYYYHILAPLLVMNRNLPAYEQLCGKIQATFTNTTNPYWAERMAIDCLLRPNPVVDLHLADRMADTAVTLGSRQKNRLPHFQVCKAMSSYRLGRYAEATTWANKSLDGSPAYIGTDPWLVNNARPQACAVMSMANWQLGRPVEARQMLAKSEALAPDIAFKRGVDNFTGPWIDWAITRIEINEAKALVESESPQGPPNKP